MFCPKCGYEYRDGFSVCSDCNVQLIDKIEGEKFLTSSCRLNKIVESNKSIIFEKFICYFKSKKFNKFSCISVRLYYLLLAVFNILTIRYISLWVNGPSWEIPVNLVGSIKFTKGCAIITVFLSIIFYGFGYRRIKLQTIGTRIISSLWLIGSIILFFISAYSRDLSEQNINLIIHYWWVSTSLPLILFYMLMYKDYKIRNK